MALGTVIAPSFGFEHSVLIGHTFRPPTCVVHWPNRSVLAGSGFGLSSLVVMVAYNLPDPPVGVSRTGLESSNGRAKTTLAC